MDFEGDNAKEWSLPTPSTDPERGQPKQEKLLPARPSTLQAPARSSALQGQTAAAIKGAASTTKATVVKGEDLQGEGDDTALIHEWNRFALSPDTAAKDAWRRRHQPDGSFRVPLKCGVIYDSIRSATRNDKRAAKSFSLQAYLDQIGLATGSFIELPAKADARLLYIWGGSAQVEAAKVELQALVDRYADATVDWAKIHKHTEKKLRSIERRQKEEAERQSFRRNPPDGEIFPCQAIFMWPLNRFPATVLLGNNLEAFDPIRTDNRSFITWLSEESQMQIFTAKPEYMQSALRRIHMTLREIVVRSLPAGRIYMIEPIHPGAVQREIQLVLRRDITRGVAVEDEAAVPRLTGAPPSQGQMEAWDSLQPRLAANNRKCLERSIKTVLDRLRYFRGQIRMRVYFGTMSFRAYKRPRRTNHSLEEFFTMLQNPQTLGEVVQELDQSVDDISVIACCREAINLLTPVDVITQSLQDVEPQYTATFEIRTLEKSYSARLHVTFAKTVEQERYDISSVRWTKKAQTKSQDPHSELRKEKVPLTMATMDLERNTAWELAITCQTILDESHVAPSMRSFVESIGLQTPSPASKGARKGHASLQFKATPVQVESCTLCSHYRYLLKGSTYVVDIDKEETSTFKRQPPPSTVTAAAAAGAAASGAAASGAATSGAAASGAATAAQRTNTPVKTSTTWKASMYNLRWDSILEQQSYLRIGQDAPWDVSDNLATFFPVEMVGRTTDEMDKNDGIGQFLKKVRLVGRLVEARNFVSDHKKGEEKAGKPGSLLGNSKK